MVKRHYCLPKNKFRLFKIDGASESPATHGAFINLLLTYLKFHSTVGELGLLFVQARSNCIGLLGKFVTVTADIFKIKLLLMYELER